MMLKTAKGNESSFVAFLRETVYYTNQNSIQILSLLHHQRAYRAGDGAVVASDDDLIIADVIRRHIGNGQDAILYDHIAVHFADTVIAGIGDVKVVSRIQSDAHRRIQASASGR